jgi:hypothetical protein
VRIRFTQDAIYETEGVGRGPTFAAGSVHELRDDLARRWLRREMAVEEPEDAAPATAAPAADDAPQPARSRAPRRTR